ncbi:MAG: sodium:solute symporter family protein [Halobacteriovoraceae bacterium]|nr:sodium:solute symporter family protein [Halobacteriovoraceae bacterium]
MSIESNPEFSHLLSFADWSIFFTILALTFLVSFFSRKFKNRGNNEFLDYMIMGRKLTLPLFVGTLVATWYGGIWGVTEIAFNQGLYNFLTQGVFWYFTYILFAFFLVDKIKDYPAITLPELIGEMYGPRSKKMATLFNFFNVLPIAYVISLGLFVKLLWPIPLWLAMTLGLIVVLGYSTYSGFRAIVYSDMLQFAVMCSSVFLVILFSLLSFGGINFLKNNLEPHYFSFTGKNSWATTLVWGFIALSTLVDPNFYQRVFAAQSKAIAKKGILASTIIWMGFDLCTTFGAMYAKAVIPDAESSRAYANYALQLLPTPLKGFFLAGILATILSTLDSYLFLSATTISYDWLEKKKNLMTQYFSVLFTGSLAIGLALVFDGNIKSVWKTLGSYSAACFMVPVLYGYLKPHRISDRQFVWASLLGAFFLTSWKLCRLIPSFNDLDLSVIDEFYLGVLGTFIGLIFFRPH